MIAFSTNVSALLAQSSIQAFYMLKITNSAGIIYRSTTHYANVTLSDGVTYLANSTIISADPPQLSTSVDREIYKITIATNDYLTAEWAPGSPTNTFIADGGVGYTLESRLGFIGAAGVPLTTITDTLLIYKGLVESVSASIKTGDFGDSFIQISGSSPMNSLDMKKFIYLSKETIRKRDATDTCCDQIYQGSSALTLKWGKG